MADKPLVYTDLPQASLIHYKRFIERRPVGSAELFQADWKTLLAIWVQHFDEDTTAGIAMGCEFMFALMTKQLEEE